MLLSGITVTPVDIQVHRTGFGNSVKLVNADSKTVLRSCGLEEEVRDTVLEDGNPAARWSLIPCGEEECWFALRPTSDNSEVRMACMTSSKSSQCLLTVLMYVGIIHIHHHVACKLHR